ncbi:Uncharacterised protein [Serratia marcescens]|nr:Uncharacterised protein [Serratia marcescens]
MDISPSPAHLIHKAVRATSSHLLAVRNDDHDEKLSVSLIGLPFLPSLSNYLTLDFNHLIFRKSPNVTDKFWSHMLINNNFDQFSKFSFCMNGL